MEDGISSDLISFEKTCTKDVASFVAQSKSVRSSPAMEKRPKSGLINASLSSGVNVESLSVSCRA